MPNALSPAVSAGDDDDDDEATVVSHAPQDILASLATDRKTDRPPQPAEGAFGKPAEKQAEVAAVKKPTPAAGGRAPTLAERVAAVAHKATTAERAERASQMPPPVIDDEAAEWRRVFDDFVRTKRECGEPTEGLGYEKFETTLKKNRDQLVARHGCKRVKFSVYVKEGKAALKASPVRE